MFLSSCAKNVQSTGLLRTVRGFWSESDVHRPGMSPRPTKLVPTFACRRVLRGQRSATHPNGRYAGTQPQAPLTGPIEHLHLHTVGMTSETRHTTKDKPATSCAATR
jgi:hypothetical protein